MSALDVGGHTFDLTINRLSGKEHLHYDGDDVSSERNLGHATHAFTAQEDGQSVAYEVDTSNKVVKGEISVIRRDGTTVYPTE